MYEPDFRGANAKAQQALGHELALRKYIKREIDAEERQTRLGIKFDATTGEHVIYISHLPDMERHLLHISISVGDICHNLRAALNLLVFQLALQNTDGNLKNRRRVQFPIEDTSEMFKVRCTAADNRGWITDVHSEAQAIIESSNHSRATKRVDTSA